MKAGAHHAQGPSHPKRGWCWRLLWVIRPRTSWPAPERPLAVLAGDSPSPGWVPRWLAGLVSSPDGALTLGPRSSFPQQQGGEQRPR